MNIALRAHLCTVLLIACLASAGSATARKGLVVISPKRFSPALVDFVEHKRKDIPTELVSIEEVLAKTSGVDDAEKLKRFLYNRWRTRDVGYCLLVGDADVMPARYMVLDRITEQAFDYAFYPSDLYYADLAERDGTFDDWNAERKGFHARYFGEVRGEKNKADPINYDQVDYRPEIAVGRWPANTAREVRLIAGKTIAHERAAAGESASWQRSATFVVVGGWVDVRDTMDELASHLPSGWEAGRLFYSDASGKWNTPPPDEKEVSAVLNKGVGLLVHAGHGSDLTWEGCFDARHLPRITNAGRLPVIISVGCSTARFATLPPYEAYVDAEGVMHKGTLGGEVFKSPPPSPACYQTGSCNPPGLGEQFVRRGTNGAVAYIGCNTGSQPCAVALAEGFVEALAQSKAPRLGDCWSSAVRYYWERERLAEIKPSADWYPASIFFQAMKYMVYGDPSLRMPSPVAAGQQFPPARRP